MILVGLATLIVVLGLAAGFTAPSQARSDRGTSRVLQKGIYDDAQILYGDPNKVFTTLRALGAKVVLVSLWWGGVNGVARRRPTSPSDPRDPAYRWDTYDRTVQFAHAAGIDPIFTVIGTPSWANAAAGWNVAPKQMNDLRQFVIAAARRYSGTFHATDGTTLPAVRKWIAWNEPNNPVFLRPQYRRRAGRWVMQSAFDYAAICNAVVRAAKFVQPLNQVACGATSPRGNNQPGSIRASVSPLAFLRALKRAGAKGFDAYAHHPYYGSTAETPLSPPPPAKRGAPPTAVTLGNITSLETTLAGLYGQNVRLWITEYGYQTNPPDSTIGVSLSNQAKYMKEAWRIAKADPTVDLFIWFLLRDESRLDGWQSGLYSATGKAKPAVQAFESLH